MEIFQTPLRLPPVPPSPMRVRQRAPLSPLTYQTTVVTTSGTLNSSDSISHSGRQTQLSVKSTVAAPLQLHLEAIAQTLPLPLLSLLRLQRVGCCSTRFENRQKVRDHPSAAQLQWSLSSGSRSSRRPPPPSSLPPPPSTAPPPSESVMPQSHKSNSSKRWTRESTMAPTTHQAVKMADDSSCTSIRVSVILLQELPPHKAHILGLVLL